jgi:hypothetical protein
MAIFKELNKRTMTSASRQNFFTISTVVGLMIVFSFYFFIYIPSQEKKLEKENFRVLTKITANIQDHVNEYKQYINGRARISIEYAPYFETDEKKDETIFENKYTRTLSSVFLDSRPELELIYFCPASADPDLQLIKDKLEHQAGSYFLFVRDTCSYDGKYYEYGFTLNEASINYLLHDNAFENYLLRRNDKIITGPEAGILAGAEDSLLKQANGIKTSRFFSQEISGSVKQVFAQPFNLGTEDSFVLCGIMDQSDYHKKTWNLSGTVILIVVLTLFLLALCLPFVKFLLMSRSERLNVSDAFLAGISVILGTSVVMLILLDVYTYYIPSGEARKTQLHNLSDSISKNFQGEISASCRQLELYDSLVGTDQKRVFSQNFISLRDTTTAIKIVDDQGNKTADTVKNPDVLRPTAYSGFSQVFWTDSAGKQLFKWSATNKLTPLINLGERNYFKNIIKDKVWSLPGKPGKEFYFEGIYSWTTGENMAVIAMKSDHKVLAGSFYNNWDEKRVPEIHQTRMAGMTSVLNSVMDPLLPMTNGFCIIDNTGKVIFHSDKKKNLSENFLDECSARDEISSAMYSRTAADICSDYHGSNYKMFIQPIDNLPFYMVTFQDNLYGVTSNTEVLSLSALLVIFFFIFICIQAIILQLITARESLLKAKDFNLDWLWPLEKKQKAYQHILIFLIPSFIILMFFVRKAGPIETLLLFFASSIFVFVFSYLKIGQFKENGERKTYRELMVYKNNLVLGCGLSLLIIINCFAMYFIGHFSRFCLFGILQFVLAVVVMYFDIPVLKSFTYRKSYLIFQFGILALISIIPTFAFFRLSFEKEAEIHIRHGQLELATELNRKSDELNKTYHIANAKYKDIYSEPFYNTRFVKGNKSLFRDTANRVSAEEDNFSRMTVSLTPAYNEIVTQEHDLANSALDGAWKWKREPGDRLKFIYYDLQKSSAPGADTLLILSDIPAYKLPMPFGASGFGVRGTLFWIGILCCFIALYCFIRFFVRIIFSTDFFRKNSYSKPAILEMPGYLEAANIFLVGVPHSGKTSWLKEQYDPGKAKHHINLGKVKTQEDINSHLEKSGTAEIIIVDHFEHGMKDFAVLRKRLKLFEGLRNLENKKILVMSNIHPLMFVKEYPSPPEKPSDETEKSTDAAVKPNSDRERWTALLGGYHKLYFPACGLKEKDEAVQDIVDKECRNSFFLCENKEFIRESLDREDPGHKFSDEEIILRIESIAHVYYNSIWLSLSEEEQYVLYDIAQDGLVNLKNREVLIMLLNKGILQYDNRFRMMNESFRNFVLSEVSAEDALLLERKVKETGSWNYFKTPVVIILLAIAMFISITQQETFNSIIAFVTTFAAAIPMIFKLLGMVTSRKGVKVKG